MYRPHTAAKLLNWRNLALAGLLFTAAGTAQAQTLNYGVANAVNVAGTYTDLGTNGTAITTANNDDANSAAQNIGFTFNFNGQAFTQFVLNTNGLIKLGNTPPSTALAFTDSPQDPSVGGPVNSSDAADRNLLLPFNTDLEPGTGGTPEFRVATTGTAPNRVTTIQWENMSDKATTTPALGKQYGNISFQVKLYETTNNVEFVYGPSTAGAATTGAEGPKYVTVGLKGSGNSQAQVVLATKGSAAAWSTATFQNSAYLDPTQGNGLNIRRSVLNDAGRTFRFGPLLANDAEVQVIYSMGKLPRGLATPHVVRAVIRNVGTSAVSVLPVTLNVTGANTFSNTQVVNSLPVGGSVIVSFNAFSPTNLGDNTLTVSTLADDNNNNNSKTYTQTVTDNVFSFANNGPSSNSIGFNTTQPEGAFVTRFSTAAARNVTEVRAFLASSTVPANTSVGRTVYAVVLGPTGTLLGRTPNYVIQASDVNAYKAFTFTTPVAVAPGNFHAGLVELTTGGQFFPMGIQPEMPTRAAQYFTIFPFTATGGTLTDAAPSNFGPWMIEAVVNVVSGTSKALDNAIGVYPNPSNGQLTLDVRGANAKNGLQVEVTNTLGQRVHTASVRDNFENKLNLSGLAAGMYHLKVSNGSEYMMRTITISK